MLYYLIYCSTAVELMTDETLKFLLQQARSRNREMVITGLLVYIEGENGTEKQARFIQVLEGSRFVVETVFDKIKNDSRHREVIVLERTAINKRNFKTWDMGFAKCDAFPSEDAALDFLKSFYK